MDQKLAAPMKTIRTAAGIKRYIALLTVAPVALFFTVANLIAFGYFYLSNWTYVVLGCLLLSGWSRIHTGIAKGGQDHPYELPMGFLTVFATIFGSIFGLYVYDNFSHYTFLYQNSRSYQNVLPSAPALAYADAGRFSFAKEVYVDREKAVAYSTAGRTFCVAPIRDLAQSAHVEWWAAGYDCCSNGDFKCDASSDDAARGGIVVFDAPGVLGSSNWGGYNQARKKAEATFNLNPDTKVKYPLFVRWVLTKNINQVETYYRNMAWVLIGIGSVIFVLPSMFFAWLFQQVYYRKG